MPSFIVLNTNKRRLCNDEVRYTISVKDSELVNWLRIHEVNHDIIELVGASSMVFNIKESTLLHIKLVWS